MDRLTLVIGGPKHGELVNWRMEHPGAYWAVPVINEFDRNLMARHMYRSTMISLLGFKIFIWVSEYISYADEQEELAKLLIPEILSYKGARILDYANYKFDKDKTDDCNQAP